MLDLIALWLPLIRDAFRKPALSLMRTPPGDADRRLIVVQVIQEGALLAIVP
ncbi:hypothetical protein AWB65_03254 [Caballeronia humi]|uniref:Uncharacterized protein n=1 Tax=Caballeronia humi TaxID=326474 RepID=A0A158HE87_9BURK|nr:hypothetical protein [Caballeronia humi]SAL42685.1 hypothetical protein AWB65_03254 [Caballeronia humi]